MWEDYAEYLAEAVGDVLKGLLFLIIYIGIPMAITLIIIHFTNNIHCRWLGIPIFLINAGAWIYFKNRYR